MQSENFPECDFFQCPTEVAMGSASLHLISDASIYTQVLGSEEVNLTESYFPHL